MLTMCRVYLRKELSIISIVPNLALVVNNSTSSADYIDLYSRIHDKELTSHKNCYSFN